MKYAPAISFVALAVALLSGCATESDPLPGFAGEPESPGTRLVVEGYPDDAEDPLTAGVRAFATSDQFTVVTMGSLSCPVVADLADIDQERQTVTVDLTNAGGNVCTADSSPRTFVFEVDRDLSTFSVQTRNPDEG